MADAKGADPGQGCCSVCGRPYAQAGRFYRRRLCWACGLAYARKNNRKNRQRYRRQGFVPGRISEGKELAKITGVARLLRERRIARYRGCIERGDPIVYEPPDLS